MTAGGRQPMIIAEALASIDMAWIFAFIFLRSRSTRDRLPSASDRLPPDFCWIEMTMPKKFASATGMRSYSLTQASPSGRPNDWVSTMARNSLQTGSGESLAMTLMQSSSGSPALMPRTMTSTASGKCLRNFASRRFLRNLRSQRGNPKAPAKPSAAAPSSPASRPSAISEPERAQIPLMTRNFCFDQLEPGLRDPHRERRRFGLGAALLDLLQAAFDLLAARFLVADALRRGWRRAATPVRTTDAWRFSAFRSPDNIG